MDQYEANAKAFCVDAVKDIATSIDQPTTEALAIAAFEANERYRGMMVMNSPTAYEDRKKAAVDLALAQEAAFKAQRELDARVRGEAGE